MILIRKGRLASVYSLQGADCRDGNVLKAIKSVGTVEMRACGWRHVRVWYPERGSRATVRGIREIGVYVVE